MRTTITVLLAVLSLCAPAASNGATVVASGNAPDAIVDRDGITHLVWNESRTGNNPDVTHYCQIPPGGTACTNAQSFVPQADSAGYHGDLYGPRVMVTPFGEVIVLTNRFGRSFGTRANPNLLYISEDAGRTFGAPAPVGDQPPGGAASGGSAVFDGADRRVLTATGRPQGVLFQAAPVGGYTTAAANLAPGVEGRSTSVVVRGRNSFVVSWLDNNLQAWVRTYTCTLDPCPLSHANNAANWAPAVKAGEKADQPRLAAGPSGTFLFYRAVDASEYRIRKLEDAALAAAQPVAKAKNYLRDITQDANGTLHTLFGDENLGLGYRASADGGATWGPQQLIAGADSGIRVPKVVARTTDTGFTGFAFWESNPNNAPNPPILMNALPAPSVSVPQLPTPPIDIPAIPGVPGQDPSPPPPPPPAACRLLAFAQLDVIAEGCLVKEGDTYIATGNLKVNGLRIELGSGKLRFDQKKRTVTTSGASVTVKADSVVLFKAPINWKLPPGPSVNVGSVDVGTGGGKLLGFPIKGSAELKFRGGGAEVPLHLGLPKLLGGVTADLTLRADNVAGIHLRELHAKVGDAKLGPLEIKDLYLDYDADNAAWKGGATAILPPQPPGPSLTAEIGFKGGELEFLKGAMTPPSPGIVLDTFGATYLKTITFALETQPALRLGGGVTITSGPVVAGVAAVAINGKLELTLGNPVIFRVSGDVKVAGIPLADAFVELNSDGGAKFGGHLTYEITAFKAIATIDGWVDQRGFSAEAASRICIGDACEGGRVVFSSVGFAGCADFGPISVGAGYKWGATPSLIAGSCDLAPYRGDATAAQARTVSVKAPGGVVGVSGATAAPHVTLVGPKRLTDTPGTATSTAFHAENTTYFIVRTPGTYQVEGEGITTVRAADVLPQPSIRASVQRGRTLRYDIKPIPGQTVTFAEVGKGVAKTLGRARGRRGTLRFKPAAGPAGRRRIVAQVSSYGKPREEVLVATYTPPRETAGRVKRLKARRSGTRLVATWARTAGARRYEVSAKLSDGRTVLVRQAGVRFRLDAVANSTSATVSITPLQANGTRGRTSTVKLARRPAGGLAS